MRENLKTFFWILGLAALSVGARNFEEGMSIDAPLYATIARNIARSSEWFRMHGNIPDFVPFAEHPHGAFWLQALIYKVLPIADWSSRIQGHLFYILSLFLIFKSCSRYLNDRVATLSVLLLWIWPVYSNFFSTFYLDPGSIFFGFFFLYALARAFRLEGRDPPSSHKTWNDYGWATVAGISLGLSFLFKGLTGLAFGIPATALVVYSLWSGYSQLRLTRVTLRLLPLVFVCLSLAVLGAAVYKWALESSHVPNFFELYWDRQVSNRFGQSWSFKGFFNLQFWTRLLRETHFLLLFLPLSLWIMPKRGFLSFCALSFASFVLVYAPNHRVGSQYWILIFPPVAILLSYLITRVWSSFNVALLQRRVLFLSVGLVALIQYLPFKTHHPRKPGEVPLILELKSAMGESASQAQLIIAGDEHVRSFIYAAPFAWYADIEVHYLSLENFAAATLPSKLKNPQQSLLLRHELPGTKDIPPCVVNFKHDGLEIPLELVKDNGGTSVYAPRGLAPQLPRQCLDSKS